MRPAPADAARGKPITALTLPRKKLPVRVTVPAKSVAVCPHASCAVTRTSRGSPAVAEVSGRSPPLCVTAESRYGAGPDGERTAPAVDVPARGRRHDVEGAAVLRGCAEGDLGGAGPVGVRLAERGDAAGAVARPAHEDAGEAHGAAELVVELGRGATRWPMPGVVSLRATRRPTGRAAEDALGAAKAEGAHSTTMRASRSSEGSPSLSTCLLRRSVLVTLLMVPPSPAGRVGRADPVIRPILSASGRRGLKGGAGGGEVQRRKAKPNPGVASRPGTGTSGLRGTSACAAPWYSRGATSLGPSG